MKLTSMWGRVLMALALFTAALSIRTAQAAPGDLDSTFGTFGKVAALIGSTRSAANAAILQPDGKIVVAGQCYVSASVYVYCVARFTATGALDSSFGNGGSVITSIGSGNNQAYAVALQKDGGILLAGECAGTAGVFCVVRLTNSGALDTTFGGSGKVIATVGPSATPASVSSLAVQPDGKIIAAGWCVNKVQTSVVEFCLARFGGNGVLDSTFGNAGVATTSVATFSHDTITSIALQSDGKIVAAGVCKNTASFAVNPCLARLTVSGALDSTFNGNGRLVTSLSNSPLGQGSTTSVTYVALQPDNQIVIAFRCITDDGSGATRGGSCLARFSSTGGNDSTFTNGAPRIDSSSPSDCSTNYFSLQPDARSLTVGRTTVTDVHTHDIICVLRRTDTGLVDTSFGVSGRVTTLVSSGDDEAIAVLLQPDGKLVAVGVCNNNTFCITRYLGGPFSAQNCSMDVDGDGQVLGTTDALIIARVSLGMSGSAVLSGISFPSYAARQTWPAIRDYLVNQCGMSVVP